MSRDFSLNATLVKRIDVTPELVRYFVKPDQPPSSFHAGQYVALALPGSAPRAAQFPPEEVPQAPDKLIKRAYSIGSSPEDPSVLEFYVALLPQGALTARLAALKVGDRLFAAPKVTGTFTLEGVPAEANLVFVSTGTGIAPFMAMLRTRSTIHDQRQITVVHGVRYPQDLAYRDELEALVTSGRVTYHAVVSRAGAEWQGRRGHVQTFFEDGTIKLDPSKDHVFLCGNPAMIDHMESMLITKGYSVHSKKNPGSLHVEKYW